MSNLRHTRLITVLLGLGIFFTSTSNSQTVTVLDSAVIPGTTVVIAGEHFNRSGYHNLFAGKHYRKEWSTPVRVKNLNLDEIEGGLKATEEGGSRQSRGLRLKNAAGKEWVLRSIDKDFGNGLPKEFHGTFIARIAKDQASIGHPYAAPTVGYMIKNTGIYHTNPRIFFVPKQVALGEFNDKYGDQLYLLEERPDENQEHADYFGNSKNVIGSDKLYEKVFGDYDNRVDQKAFAKARLFDLFIGDWGRHPAQWRWAEFKGDPMNVYRPIPRDRDQAYTRFDGFWPWVATNLAGPGTFLENYDGHLNKIRDFNEPGRPVDRPFLNELSRQDWVDAAKELQASLTDDVIETGMRQMPAEIFAISGEKLVSDLKSRRNELTQYAERFYSYLAQHVSLVGSQKRELFEINRLNDKETEVNIYKINSENEVTKPAFYSRTFSRGETKDIKIYSLEGADRIVMKGSGGVPVMLIDPDKTDSFDMENKSRTKIFRGNQFEYDTTDRKKFDFSLRPLLSPSEYSIFNNDPIQLFTRFGLKVSMIFRFNPQPFRKPDYAHQHMLSANYGFLRKAVAVAYIGRLKQYIGRMDLLMKVRADVPAAQNFYGIGNETPNATKTNTTYYSTFSNRFYAGIGLSKEKGLHNFDVNPFFQYVKVKNKGDYYLTNLFADRSVFEAKQFAGIEAGYQLRNTNSDIYPTKGIHFTVGGGYVQNIKDKSRSFIKGTSSLAVYLPLTKSFTLAVRGGGGMMSGKADFYHMNNLGGNVNLRGYPRERFFGMHSFYNNNEIRFAFNTRNYFFSGKIGLLAFFDQGRVWIPGEVSDTWHTSYGGGLMLIPFNKVVFSGTYGVSKETTDLLLTARVFF
ncbi:MAG: hypothetical protein H7Y42_01045 [Chitinophagaceae bacterium]|nr:hypothetical protein [Chitinophagaceae bacterium]